MTHHLSDSALLADLEERLLRYVQIDTEASPDSAEVPSTSRQFDLLRLLRDELVEMGARDVVLTDTAFVIARIPATVDAAGVPKIAFLAHVDTAPAFSGADVKPIVHRNYQGETISLPDDPAQVLSPANSPDLKTQLGKDVVTASGTTLLGADDKAGVAIIMTLAKVLLADDTTPRGEVRVCFTPDEEIGMGIRRLDLADLGVDFAYTLDGGRVGEVICETFSADEAVVKIRGVSIHPGDAKGKMVNAAHLAAKLAEMLPSTSRTPETTEGRQGYIHLTDLRGNAAEAEVRIILRDFDETLLKEHGEYVRSAVELLQKLEPRAQFEMTLRHQYRNMRYWLEQDMTPVDKAVEAIRLAGIEPIFEPIRGGTDGSILTERGLPTPNLFTGMHNVHGPLEWVSIQDMAAALDVCHRLIGLWARTPAGA